MKRLLVSVVVPTWGNANYIEKCVKSILNQSFKNFELIIVDDCSRDNTLGILKKFKDKRLKVFKTSKNSGSAFARNFGVNNSKGKYIFFTDSDCIASKNWIIEGLKVFEKEKCLGIEGITYYVSKSYKPTASDRIVKNLSGGQYMTCNAAYKRETIKKIGGFDPNLMRKQDRDLALKVKGFGKIVFSKNMKVYHQKIKWDFKSRIKFDIAGAKTRVFLFKRYKDNVKIIGRIYMPLNLLAIFIPPVILGSLFMHKFKSKEDYKTLLYIYPSLICERIALWKTAIKERVFLI